MKTDEFQTVETVVRAAWVDSTRGEMWRFACELMMQKPNLPHDKVLRMTIERYCDDKPHLNSNLQDARNEFISDWKRGARLRT